jgi:hypothetical protein
VGTIFRYLNYHYRTERTLKVVGANTEDSTGADPACRCSDGDDGPVLPDPEEQERVKRHVGKLRDEKLQNDAFILKKLNASLASYKEVLGDVASQNEVMHMPSFWCIGVLIYSLVTARRRTTATDRRPSK